MVGIDEVIEGCMARMAEPNISQEELIAGMNLVRKTVARIVSEAQEGKYREIDTLQKKYHALFVMLREENKRLKSEKSALIGEINTLIEIVMTLEGDHEKLTEDFMAFQIRLSEQEARYEAELAYLQAQLEVVNISNIQEKVDLLATIEMLQKEKEKNDQKNQSSLERIRSFLGGMVLRGKQAVGAGVLASVVITSGAAPVNVMKKPSDEHIQKNPIKKITKKPMVVRPREADRVLFHMIAKNPKDISLLPGFKNRSLELAYLLKNDAFFSSDRYVTGHTWKLWNGEVVKKFFPTIGDITPHEERIFIDALQQLIGIKKGGEFGRKTKERFIQYVQATHPESDPVLHEKPQTLSCKSAPFSITPISLESFERLLFGSKGTPYKYGKSDCNSTMMYAYKKSWAVPCSFFADSAGVIEQLTTHKMSINDARRGDFLFWESKKISSRTGKNIRHIMYVAGVKMEGDLLQEVRVFDNSDVTGEATFRTISIDELSRKKKVIVGTPKFFTQQEHFSEHRTPKERG